jgi:uncharacterized membrane protein YhhN
MTTRRILVALVAVACCALVVLQLLDHRVPAIAAKLLASSAFIALAVYSGGLSSLYGRLITAGLALSWCGDMFLTGQSREAFLGGLGAFLLAHVAYTAAFVARGYQRSWAFGAAVPITAIAIGVWTWLEPHTPADMSIPVRAYIMIISLMVIFAFGTHGRTRSLLITGGAVAFFLSDLSVAALRLVQTEHATYVVGLPLYYVAQVCLALSVSQSRSH